MSFFQGSQEVHEPRLDEAEADYFWQFNFVVSLECLWNYIFPMNLNRCIFDRNAELEISKGRAWFDLP